ncbi:ATPase [Geobacter hydrogenophilus]|uniref:Nitrogenase iron protein n=1 Tax=Geobacter hydrogenophilus TaxID=40983 RepID=A0A9W6G321_9BACT|nr:ATPase [Geobacter hydrogenophilus]MBT0894385.1 ATPase [Geobacter hydrogenophilus]GLI39459.1 nitrogenase iron protein [Geobacter hydrogenophilus]
MTPEHIVIAGRSGVGNTTTAVNISAALAEERYRVAHVGYDPRRLSTAPLRGQGKLVACGEGCLKGSAACVVGYRGILCVEAGNGGEGEGTAVLGKLCHFEEIARHRLDYVIHDISGEPETVLSFLSETNEPWRLLVVTSADIASIHTLNDYIARFNELKAGKGRFGGVIANNLSGPFFESVVGDFIRETGAHLVANIPRSMMISVGEFCTLPLVEVAPQGHVTAVYRKLARAVAGGKDARIPSYLDERALAAWSLRWREIIDELEGGIVRDGAAI